MPVTSKQVNGLLMELFGFELDFNSDPRDLMEIARLYNDRRTAIVLREGGGNAMATPEFAKAHLICEAIRVHLREIAPRRMKRKKTK